MVVITSMREDLHFYQNYGPEEVTGRKYFSWNWWETLCRYSLDFKKFCIMYMTIQLRSIMYLKCLNSGLGKGERLEIFCS